MEQLPRDAGEPNSVDASLWNQNLVSTVTVSEDQPSVISVATDTAHQDSSSEITPSVLVGTEASPFHLLTPSAQEQVIRQHLEHLMMMQTQSGHHHHHHHHHANPESPIQTLAFSPASVNAGSTSEVVVNMDQQQEVASSQSHTSGQSMGPQQSGSGTAGQRRRRQQVGEQLEAIPGLRMVIQNLEGAVPFLILLFSKVMYNHRFGLLVFVAMLGTFNYANSFFKKLTSLRDTQTWRETVFGYFWIFSFLAANIIIIYFIFSDQKLYKCLYFQNAEAGDLDLWTLLWIVVITDFVIKFSTVVIKSVIALLPKYVLPYKRKGRYYLLIEMISQFYRCLIPIRPWIIFMLEDRYGGQWVAVVLLIAYCCLKVMHLKGKFLELRQAVVNFGVDSAFGTSPSKEELKAFDNTCPICQDMYTDAVKLSCKHIFCDACICLWLDREKTCPMCRAHIADNPIWRDGSTSGLIQFY